MAIEVTGVWQGGFATRLEDDRGHVVTTDLPLDEGGADVGTSALELAVLSLAGCIVTIFLLIAKRRRLAVERISIRLAAERGERSPTIDRVGGTFTIRTSGSAEEIETALRLTVRTCPVGVLFDNSGVPVHLRIVREGDPPSPDPEVRLRVRNDPTKLLVVERLDQTT